MVNVTIAEVRGRLNLSDSDIADKDVTAYIAEAAAVLSDEIDSEIDPNNCTEKEANAVRNLAAIYCYCHVTGTFSGISFKSGVLSVDDQTEIRTAKIAFLKEQVDRFVRKAKEANLRAVSA